MNKYFSGHDVVKIKVETKPICGIDADIGFSLF